MKKALSLEHSLDTVAALLALAAITGVLQSFIIGKHYIIPTGFLLVAILFGNLARFGFRGARFAKRILFWTGFLLTCHAFFALFWAITPREMLGQAFFPVYGLAFVGLGFLTWQYARHNQLFGDGQSSST